MPQFQCPKCHCTSQVKVQTDHSAKNFNKLIRELNDKLMEDFRQWQSKNLKVSPLNIPHAHDYEPEQFIRCPVCGHIQKIV